MSIDNRPNEIYVRGWRCHTGKDIKTWIQYWSDHYEDMSRHEVALSMSRFLSIPDKDWYLCTLKRRHGKLVGNLERTEKVREKNAARVHSIWYYRRLRLKAMRGRHKESE